jgi:hypothetical protein
MYIVYVQGEGEEGQASLDVITLVNSSWRVSSKET